MLVKNWMSKRVITIDKDDYMEHAMELLKEHNIRMLPVLKKGELVGIVTDSDLKSASASKATSLEVHELAFLISNIKVKEIMTKDPITVPLDYTVEETAEILLWNKINGVPSLYKLKRFIIRGVNMALSAGKVNEVYITKFLAV